MNEIDIEEYNLPYDHSVYLDSKEYGHEINADTIFKVCNRNFNFLYNIWFEPFLRNRIHFYDCVFNIIAEVDVVVFNDFIQNNMFTRCVCYKGGVKLVDFFDE